ncbi:hypothetical protein PYH37_002958 [Sinorhizobium numidicum]|uniref:hypothetical protein n=1 Tax=Sinorhizobium numidicum TaxID=680248 RepID=UPI002475A16F|nr:hypothetical protein [Sinorhizobium numidicum]WEX78106.1 hypothetical protein PYH37_002958 [Sinorhizobium numidicum]
MTDSARQKSDLRNHNLHIGRTIRDLQMHTEEKLNARLQGLLEELEKAERKIRR